VGATSCATSRAASVCIDSELIAAGCLLMAKAGAPRADAPRRPADATQLVSSAADAPARAAASYAVSN